MIGVTVDVCLQHDLFFLSGQSAAIDEVPDYMPNLSDVGVCGNVITIRQNKSREPPGTCFKRVL